MSKVLFATKCWERDWHKFLSGTFQEKVAAIDYPFAGVALMLNNGIPDEMKEALTVTNGFTLDVPVMEPYIYEHFTIDDDHFAGGKWYALAELGAILYAYKEGYDYLCWVQGDCITTTGDWVTEGIRTLEREPGVAVVAPYSTVNTWHNKLGYDTYMSDQAFLLRTKEFAEPAVYHHSGVDADYPDYGGNSFEAMVGKYLKATGRKRKVYMNHWCIHGV